MGNGGGLIMLQDYTRRSKLLAPHQSHISTVKKMCVRLEKVDANCLWNYRLWGYLYLILMFWGPRAAKKAREKQKGLMKKPIFCSDLEGRTEKGKRPK